MLNDEILVMLEGPHDRIDPRAVAEAIVALDKILRYLRADAPVSLKLSQLEIGSAKVAVRSDPQRVRLVHEGLDVLASTTRIPAGWSAESIAGLVELEHVARRSGVEKVLLKTSDAVAAIDEQLAQQARASIAPPPPSLGAVRGILHRYINDRYRRSAGLRDYRSGHVIEVHFPGRLVEQVRAALDLEVELWGEVHRDVRDRVQSISISGIEILDQDTDHINVGDVAGLFGPDWTDGLDTVEWVRRQRG